MFDCYNVRHKFVRDLGFPHGSSLDNFDRIAEIVDFTDVPSPYKPPVNPLCCIATCTSRPDECSCQVRAAMTELIALPSEYRHHEGEPSVC